MGERRRFHWPVLWTWPLAALVLIIGGSVWWRAMAISPVRPRLHDSYDAVSEHDLRLLEKEIGAPLPNEYRQFILSTNGGEFSPGVEFRSAEGEFLSGLNRFYGIGPNAEDELGWVYRTLKPYLPAGLLPIGIDIGGTETCIMVTGENVGSIWIWHPHGDDDTGSFVANSFDAFSAGLCYGELAETSWDESLPDFIAAERGDEDALAEHLKDGLDPNSRNNEGSTLLICAAAANQPEIVKLLLDHHADIEARDVRNRTALHWAASRCSFDSVELLVASGANLETADAEGETPLLVAVSSGTRVAKFLMKQGANVHAKNLNGDGIFALSQDYADELHPIIREHGGRE